MSQYLASLSQSSGIREIVLSEIVNLAEKHNLSQVILFGSRARGNHHRKSDIDLAISGGNTASFALDTDEETSTLLMYDFVELKPTTAPELLSEIRRDGKTIYEKI